ncbi:SLATT domain-containing protein [Methylobacterium brachiatum]|uniref:SLATT domain-containing protein n=1 Tax=Methylobacterium brachiatum TaxID=269660 RepID=UPI000B82B4A6|nr:SLATT domain-containing protein [Methylobacterium brachiatum]
MDKAHLLKSIAETGYNVGFGAKKHFATYDIVEKGPGWIGFISLACGISGLVFEELSTKVPSLILSIAGVVALYISFYRAAEYEKAGKEITAIYNELRDLYRSVQSDTDSQLAAAQLSAAEARFFGISISKQILFSDWYAHYKFFGQHQSSWINEQLNFKFWKDMVPASAKLFLVVLGMTSIIGAAFLIARSCGLL